MKYKKSYGHICKGKLEKIINSVNINKHIYGIKNLDYNLNITQSFSTKGCHYDNACIESFHVIIKKEEIYRNI